MTDKPDPRAEKPEEKPTVKFAEVPTWAVELTRSVKTGFATLGADIALVSNDLGAVKGRVALLETHRNDMDARANRTSARVQQASDVDLEQAAQLAHERTAREALAAEVAAIKAETTTQTQLLSQLLKLTEKPVVKLIATAVGTAILTWLSARGLR